MRSPAMATTSLQHHTTNRGDPKSSSVRRLSGPPSRSKYAAMLYLAITISFAASFPSVFALNSCESWQRLAEQMRSFENHTGSIACETVNCSGVNCAGYLQENFTVGVFIDPCAAPLGVQIHGSVPALKSHPAEQPWSEIIYPNETASAYPIPGGKLVIEGVEMDIFVIAQVIGYPNATMDVDITLKGCIVDEGVADPTKNCSFTERILKSGPVKVPPCHLHPSEGEIHTVKPHPPVISSSDAQDYNSGGYHIGSISIPASAKPTPSAPIVPTSAAPSYTELLDTLPANEIMWSKRCSLKDLFNYFACDVRNHEVCSPLAEGSDHGACICQVAYSRSSTGICLPSPTSHFNSDGDSRGSKSGSHEDEEHENDASPASSSKFAERGHLEESSSHGGAVAAGILIPILIITLIGGAFYAYRKGFCPPRSLQQPLRFSLSRFSANRTPGMVLIGDGDDEATA